MFGYRWILLVVLLQIVKTFEDSSMLADLNELSELPLNKLLQVKNSMEQEEVEMENRDSSGEIISTSLDTSHAQALHGKVKKPYQRGSYETSWQKKSGKKGLSTIFQISITALAFLAFGGYLLCLLVQALKHKHHPQMVMMTGGGGTGTGGAMMMVAAPVRRRRPIIYRHRRDVIWPETNTEQLYHALKMFSEGYATYHTVDYKYYNFTVDSLG